MNTPSPDSAVRRGRPSMLDQRRVEIIDAFVALISRHGLEAVTLNDVAAEAGMARSAVRHFIGNRQGLIAVAITELAQRYVDAVQSIMAEVSDVDGLIRAVFGTAWNNEMAGNDRAFESLIQEALRDPVTTLAVREAYDSFLGETLRALRQTYPHAPTKRARGVAYAILCLVEHNTFMQQLGYSATLSRSTAGLARTLAHTLAD